MYYNALGDHLRARFGRKVYKLSLRGVTTCPNRDGTVGTRGCLFCSESGSGEFAACGADIAAQLSDGVGLIRAFSTGGSQKAVSLQCLSRIWHTVKLY